jgi:hypothetical protein
LVEAWGRAATAEGWWQGAGSEAGPGGVVEGAGYIAGEPMRNDTERTIEPDTDGCRAATGVFLLNLSNRGIDAYSPPVGLSSYLPDTPGIRYLLFLRRIGINVLAAFSIEPTVHRAVVHDLDLIEAKIPMTHHIVFDDLFESSSSISILGFDE